MKASYLFALGLGGLVLACSGTSDGVVDDENTGASQDELSARAACRNKSCGDECSLCRPGQRNCFETAVLKQCGADGRCRPRVAVCDDNIDGGSAPDNGGAIDAGPGPYDACGGKSCGDPCSLCAPWDADCAETAVLKVCDGAGSCQPSFVVMCDIDAGPGPYDPCGGKSCGDPCSICAPGDADCVETAVLKVCDAIGRCSTDFAVTCPPTP